MRSSTDLSAAPAGVGPLGRIAGWSFRHRGLTLLLWLAAFVAAFALQSQLAGSYNADYSAPGSDSRIAQDLLAARFPQQSGDTITVVVHADAGINDPATRQRIDAVLAQLGTQPHVRAVESPYAPG